MIAARALRWRVGVLGAMCWVTVPASAAEHPLRVSEDGRYLADRVGTGRAAQAFTPPSSGPGRDWLLVLDAPRKGFPPPGQGPGTE